MKTAISIPDEVFASAEKVAKRLGVSRSELYARAVSRLVETYEGDRITQALDELYAHEDSGLDPVIELLQAASLPREEW